MAMQQLIKTTAIAISYILLGILSLRELNANQYVSGFWLPSGLVAALALQWGYRPLVGIFFGEMITGFIYGHGPLWMPIAVALSQVLQGLIICLLAPRLMKGKDIFISLANLGGFLAAVSVAIAVHTFFGGWLIPQWAGREIMPFPWFIGGLSGAIVVAPLLLSWLSAFRERPKIPWIESAAMILAAVVGVNMLNLPLLESIRGLWIIVFTSFLFWGAFRFPPTVATAMNAFLVELFIFIPPNIWKQMFQLAPASIRVVNVPILMTTYLVIALAILVVNGDRQKLTQQLKKMNCQLLEQVEQKTTELDQAQAELAKTALAVTEGIPVGTYTMVLPPGESVAKFSFMSERFLELSGLDREEAKTNPLKAFNGVHPDDREAWIALNAESFAKKTPFSGVTRSIVKGEVRWLQAESVPRQLADGSTIWEGVLTDITQTKLYEQQLQQANAEITALNQDLEDRVKKRTAELEKSQAQFQRLVEDIGDQFVIFSHTVEGVLLYVSGGFEAIFGIEVKSVLGKSWVSAINWYPDSLALVTREERKLIDGDIRTQQFEMGFTRPDSKQRIVKIIQHPVYDQAGNIIAIEGVLEDITKRKKFITALAASEAKFRTFIETANDLIFSIDCNACFTYLSPNTVDILGYSPEELQGIPYANIVHSDDLPQCHLAFQRLMDGHRVWGLEYRVRRKDDAWRWHSTSLTPKFDPQGEVVGLFGFALDYTDRKLAELKQQQLNRELLKANQLKDEFLAMMSHELRTPLNSVLGMTESLQEEIFGPLNDRQQGMLQVIEESGAHLLDLINDILDLSKMEAGQMELTVKPTAVQALSKASLKFVQSQALKKQIQLIDNIPAELPNLEVDERRIRQVLINLLTNAVKFTPEGGTVTVSAALVSPEVDLKYSQMRLVVRDTGIGISPDNLQKLFKPFIQIDSALNRQYEGTGLGLSLVKSIVQLHGGEVGVSSEEGVGSCFWFTVPCVETPMDSFGHQGTVVEGLELTDDSPETQSTQPTTRPILLVARDLKKLISIESYLTAKGYCVKVVTLETAIAIGTEQLPWCWVLVMEEADPDFVTLIHACRQSPPCAQTPMIVALANGQEGIDPQPYLAAGANHYLEPPLKLRDLVRCIQQLT